MKKPLRELPEYLNQKGSGCQPRRAGGRGAEGLTGGSDSDTLSQDKVIMTEALICGGEILFQDFAGMGDRISKEAGRGVSERALAGTKALADFYRGKTAEETLWREMAERFRWDLGPACLKKMVREHMSEVLGVRGIVESLRSSNVSLAVLSVLGREWAEYLENRHRFLDLFEYASYSFATGVSPPDPNIFALAARAVGRRPRHCLYVSGSAERIAAARRAGLHTHWFVSAPVLKQELLGRGLLAAA